MEVSASAAWGGGTPVGGCLEAALLARRPRPGPLETSSWAWAPQSVPGHPPPPQSGGDGGPEFCWCGALGPGVRVRLELVRGGPEACGSSASGPRLLAGRRADGAGAWPAPIAAPRGPPVMRWLLWLSRASLPGGILADTWLGDLLECEIPPLSLLGI